MRKFITYCVFIVALLSSYAQAESQASSGARWIVKAKANGLSEVQRSTYKELAKLHTCKFQQSTHWHTIDAFLAQEANPMVNLHELGLDALPFIGEALDDATPSDTVTNSHGSVRVWKVNDFVVMLIREISDREFVIGEWGEGTSLREVIEKPELVPAFQKLIQDWHTQNRGRSVEERKISDLQSNLRNRLDAMMWLGEHKSTKAAPSIVARIERILSDKTVSSSTHAELAEASLSLGHIGTLSALPAVRKACEHLSYWIYMYYRPIEQGRSGTGSNQWVNLFNAHHGMALLGKKQPAIAELRRLLREYGKEMEDHSRNEYEKLLENAEGWEDPPPKQEVEGDAVNRAP